MRRVQFIHVMQTVTARTGYDSVELALCLPSSLFISYLRFIHAPCQHRPNAERDRTSRLGCLINSNHGRVWRGRQHQGRCTMSATQLSRFVSLALAREPRLSSSVFLSYTNSYDPPASAIMQSWLVARSLSSGCREIKQSLTLQSQVQHKPRPPPVVQASVKLITSRSIRVTGRLGRGTNLNIVLKKHSITIWALNCWSMGSRGSMRVSWPVSRPRFLSLAVP